MSISYPIVLVYAAYRIFLWICRKVMIAFGLSEILIKNKGPKYLKKLRNGTDRETGVIKNLTLPFKLNQADLRTLKEIYLAGQKLPLQGVEISWQITFDDVEDFFALHRFGWVLRLIIESPNEDTGDWIKKELNIWIDKFLEAKKGPIWEPYSVSERIVNTILFSGIHPKCLDDNFRGKFYSNIREHANFLASHLEYRGKKTNNHFLNNARGLYFAGRFLGNEKFSEMARQIIVNELPKMITAAGFLREQSVHYHFLLTRSILEIWWLAKETKDYVFAGEIQSLAIKMIQCCYFFIVKDDDGGFTIPLIGDVSPDFPPDWLIAVPFSKIAFDLLGGNDDLFEKQKNYGFNWSRLSGDDLYILRKARPEQEFFIADGWLKLNRGEITVFWPIKINGAIGYHGHNDLNSFCLYFRGQPVFIDPGRYDFKKTEIGRYGRKASAHNSIIIDGREQFFLNWYGLMPLWAMKQSADIHTKSDNDTTELNIRTKNFSRKFIFRLADNEINIIDNFSGQGTHEIKTFFHLAPGFKAITKNEKEILINSEKINFKMLISGNQKAKILQDNFFPTYGQKVLAETIELTTEAILPVQMKYKLNWQYVRH